MDGHKVINLVDKTKDSPEKPYSIEIGNHVWIGAYAILMKNTKIANGSIIGMRSLVNRQFEEENVLIAGTPANVKARGKQWIH